MKDWANLLQEAAGRAFVLGCVDVGVLPYREPLAGLA